jgi:nucleotide-binding universal stress UspA family protein
MNSSILLLANLPEAAAHTARYAAAFGCPLGLRLVLLHCYLYPVLSEPELLTAATEELDLNEAETMTALRALARSLPGTTEVLEASGIVLDDMAAAIGRYQPLLLAMGLGPDQGLLDELLRSQVLPVLRDTRRPVLLVPAAATAAGPPRRVLVAVDGEPFTPNAAGQAVAPLLASWAAAYTVAHILPSPDEAARSSHLALADVRASGLLPPEAPVRLYQQIYSSPVAGIAQALADTQADLLVLIARPRSFLGALFHRSVTAAMLRHCQVPILLLPAAE